MDTVVRLANVASQGCCMTSLVDSSAFHYILLRPSSWYLFGFTYGGVDYSLRIQGESMGVSYFERGQGRVSSLERNFGTGLPRRFVADQPRRNARFPARDQGLAAREATHVTMLVSFMCGCLLSVKKCGL